MKIVRIKSPFIETQYGFDWGAAKVERTASLDDGSVVITIHTKKQYTRIRVTKSGMIRITPIEKFR